MIPVVQNINKEVTRLFKHPRLFPGSQERHALFKVVQAFRYSMNQMPDLRHEIKAGRFSEITKLVGGLENMTAMDHRASFQPGRKPWHQFLHHLAPGSNTNRTYTASREPGTGTRQIIPPGGLGLLMQWEHELDRIKKAVRSVRHTLALLNFETNATKDYDIAEPESIFLTGDIVHEPAGPGKLRYRMLVSKYI